MRRTRSRAIAGPLLVAHMLSAAGCYSWQPTPYRLPAEEMPDQMVVIRQDGYRFTLENPRIVGDSIRGDTAPAIALADVLSAEARTLSKRTTAGVVGLLVSVAALAIFLSFVPDLRGSATINGS